MALLPAARARSPPAGSAQSHLVIEHHVIADLRRLTDHNAGSVIDEKAFPNLCPGMNLDTSCNETGKLRNQAWQKRNRRLVKSVSDAMIEDRPQPLVEQRLKDVATGGGFFGDNVYSIGPARPTPGGRSLGRDKNTKGKVWELRKVRFGTRKIFFPCLFSGTL